VITQESFYRFFREDLMDAEFRPIRLPPEEMVVLAEHFPHGHFAPYAVKYLANGGYVLDHTALETVVDRPLVKLRDLYGKRDGKTYQMVKPPIGTHVKEAARKIAGNPRSAWEAAKQMPGILSYAYRNSGKGKVT